MDLKVCSRVTSSRSYAAKDINFGNGARAAMLQGVSEIAEAVKVTMGPKVLDLTGHLTLAVFLIVHLVGMSKFVMVERTPAFFILMFTHS